MDGSSNGKGSEAGVILKGSNEIVLEYSLKIDFKATNNQVKYKALIVSLQLAKEIGAWLLSIQSDLQHVIAQLKGEYEVRELLLIKYS